MGAGWRTAGGSRLAPLSDASAGPRPKVESGIHKQTWRNPSAADARWLRFLALVGYTLAEVEEDIVAAVEGRASGQAEDAADSDDEAADDEGPAEG